MFKRLFDAMFGLKPFYLVVQDPCPLNGWKKSLFQFIIAYSGWLGCSATLLWNFRGSGAVTFGAAHHIIRRSAASTITIRGRPPRRRPLGERRWNCRLSVWWSLLLPISQLLTPGLLLPEASVWSLPAAGFYYFCLLADLSCCTAGWIYFFFEEVFIYYQYYTSPRLQHQ